MRWPKTVQQRFDEKWTPEPFSGCWLWAACSRNQFGYGCFYLSGRDRVAHQVSWQIFRGDIPDGMRVLHHCDTPCCVNPHHLFLGSQSDNMNDCVSKGRLSKEGELNGRSRLTSEQIYLIRTSTSSLKEVAEQFGVTENHISKIRNRRAWRHVQ